MIVLDKYRTGGIFGYDKEGAPVYIDPFGLIDLKGWLEHFRVCLCNINYI